MMSLPDEEQERDKAKYSDIGYQADHRTDMKTRHSGFIQW